MHISPKYTSDYWRRLKPKLKLELTSSTENDWRKAIDIFRDRIDGRFLKFICLIEKDTFAGFAVLALDCLLIETLKQFWEGVRDSKGKSKPYFIQFLTNSSFGEFFSNGKAEMFYCQIRCGILHQAETKENSLIKTSGPLVKYTDDGKGLIVNRKLFHEQLMKEFETYISRLLDPSEQELREKFIKKMDYICRVSGEID